MATDVTINFSRDWQEYRVPAPDGREAGAYYTDERNDAANTAITMYRNASYLRIHWSRQDAHPAPRTGE